MNVFEWDPAVSAHSDFPTELIRGVLIDAQGGQIRIRGGRLLNGGWGKASGLAVLGDDLKPPPVTAILSYFSYAENRFFGGAFDLPTDRILTGLRNGFYNQRHDRNARYALLLIGLGAAGHVSVWMAGEEHVHEVTTTILPEIDIDWSEFRPDTRFSRTTYVDLVLKELDVEISKSSNGAERFSRLKKTYPWTLALQGDSPLGVLRMSYLNGESDTFNLMRPFTQPMHMAAPRTARLTWSGANGRNYVAYIEFDELETVKAFESFEKSVQGDLQLEMRVADTNRDVLVFLRDDSRFYAFEDIRIEVFHRQD